MNFKMNSFVKKVLGAGFALVAFAALASAETTVGLGNLPLWFEAAHDDSSRFIARGHSAEFFVSPAGGEMVLRKADGKTVAVNIQFVGGETAPAVSGESELRGKINYFTGNDPAAWQTGIHTFGKVRLADVYPGVNAVFYGNAQKLEYDLNLAAGVAPETIRVRYAGADRLTLNSQGDLVIGLGSDEVVQHRPEAYQTDAGGTRQELQSAYRLLDNNTVEFAVIDYDHTRPLVIDPIVGYSTFFGGNFGEMGWAIALDSTNNIYIAGETFSTLVSNTVPKILFATTNAAYTNFAGIGKYHGDAFVAELDSTGTNLLYCTYLGGNDDDFAYALAVSSSGEACVAGLTSSTNFPVTNWVVTASYQGSNISGVRNKSFKAFPLDAFVAKLSPGGASLEYSTLLGGDSTDGAYGVALDPLGDAYVAGFTYSTNFPVTPDAYQPTIGVTNGHGNMFVNCNAFVSEIAPGGGTLNYSTYLGGTNLDVALAIACSNNFVYVAGYTFSTNFPWVNGLDANRVLNRFIKTNKNKTDRARDAFVTVFTNTGSTLGTNLIYSTFLGSTNDDVATGIVGDGAGNAIVVGWTTSTNFPETSLDNPNYANYVQLDSFIRTNRNSNVIATNAFLTQILWTNSSAQLGYSQIFGGRGADVANGVALDGAGDVFVVGSATSPSNYPTTGNLLGALRSTNSSRILKGGRLSDVVVTVFKSDFSSLLYSAYLGGRDSDTGNAIAVDNDGNAYVTGWTTSTNFPIVGDPGTGFRNVRDGTNDAFVTKILLDDPPMPQLFVEPSGTNVLVGWVPFSSQTTPEFLALQTSTNLTTVYVITNIVSVTTNGHTEKIRVFTTNIDPDWKNIPAADKAIFTNGAFEFKFNPTNKFRLFRFRSD